MSEPNKEPREPVEPSSKKPRTPLQKRWLFFGALAAIYVLAYCLVNVASLKSFFTFIGGVLSPVFIGGILAYLLNPILKFYEYFVFRKLKRKGNLRLYLSLLCTFLTALAILAILVAMILPELYKSIKDLVDNYETYLNGLLGYVQAVIDKTDLDLDISDMEKLTTWITNITGNTENLMNEVLGVLKNFVFDSNLLGNIGNFLSTLFNSVVNFVLGIFIAFYLLSSKEKRMAQIRKIKAAYVNEEHGSKLADFVTLVDKTFGGFFKGVLVDALAVGVMMYVCLSIFRMSEYNLLIATICAITNVIPVFGPLIGAIPSGIIILMTNPAMLPWFIVLVLVIQQLDGNILVPLIQGNTTGISSLAVLISITVMGGIFGIPGMILGVPVFAVIIELGKRAIETRLGKQGKETDTTYYYRKGAVGNAEEEVYYEHAHWKYKYDHSKIKPHVDKMLAAIARLGKPDESSSGESSSDESSSTDTAAAEPMIAESGSNEPKVVESDSVETDSVESDSSEPESAPADEPQDSGRGE